MSKHITIGIAAHKPYTFPKDSGYVPLHVGSALSKPFGILADDLKDGISELNPYFCELTALHWLSKKSETEFCGLVHYRRYFRSQGEGINIGNHKIASSQELINILKKHDVILPKPRNYVIENIRTHYANSHFGEDIDIIEDIIQKSYPEYIPTFNKIFSRTSASMYNMFVMSHENTRKYSDWLFDILLQSEKRIPYKTYNAFQARVFGRIAELLINVWMDYNFDKSKIFYLPVVNIEGENLIKKAYFLLRRKILNEKMG